MNRIPRLSLAAAFAGAAMLFANPLVAQLADTPARDQTAATRGDAIPGPTLSEVESALASIEADSGIEDSAKELLRTKYAQAVESLKEAASNAAKAAEYRESITQAPDTAADLRAQLEELPSVETAGDVTASGDPNDLQRELAAQRATHAALNEQLSSVTADSSLAEQRPADISMRIPEAERELADARRQLASPDLAEDITSPGRVADRFLLRARELKLANELEMLKQEQLSQSVRRNLQQAHRGLLTRQVENASAAVAAYEALMNESVTGVARDIGARAEELRLEVRKEDEEAVALASEVQDLANKLESVPQDRQKISAAKADITTKLQRLTQRYDSIKRQLELGQPGVDMAQVLIDLRALLNTRVRKMSQMGRWSTLGQTRLAAVQVDIKVEGQSDVQEQFADRSSRAVQDLVAARGEVLDTLQTQYLDLIPMLASLESETRLYLDTAGEIQADITQQLFWIRISPPLSASTFSEIPTGLRWVLGREHWLECGRTLKLATSRAPLRSALVGLLAIVLLIMRVRIGAALRRTADGVGRVSTDRFGLTGRAVFWTALLALPVPLLVGFVAWALAQADAPSTWLRDINRGMPGAVLVVSAAFAIAACCRPGGLGAAHFGWRSESLSWLRRASHWFAIVYVPLVLLAFCTLSSDSGRFFQPWAS